MASSIVKDCDDDGATTKKDGEDEKAPDAKPEARLATKFHGGSI